MTPERTIWIAQSRGSLIDTSIILLGEINVVDVRHTFGNSRSRYRIGVTP